MNHARHQAIIDGLRGQHRKVFDAVPIQEAWTIQQVFGEIKRLGGSMAFDNIERCLVDMAYLGILVSTGNSKSRLFQKTKVRRPGHAFHLPETDATTSKETLHMPRTDPTTTPADPINELAQVASKLRADAAALIDRADAIDALAIRASDAIKEAGSSAETIAQFKKMLGL